MGPIFLGSPTGRTVGVGVHNKREKVTPTPTVLTVGEPNYNVGPNSFPPTKIKKVCCILSIYMTLHLGKGWLTM